MMKKFKSILGVILMAMAMLSVTSCDDDWYEDDWWEDSDWNDDRRAESAVLGRWSVRYIEIAYGNCPYYEYDEFNFYSNGRMEVFGDNDFYKQGRWFIEDRHIYIDIDMDNRTDMVGYIDELYRDLLSLDITDRIQNSRYYIKMTR